MVEYTNKLLPVIVCYNNLKVNFARNEGYYFLLISTIYILSKLGKTRLSIAGILKLNKSVIFLAAVILQK